MLPRFTFLAVIVTIEAVMGQSPLPAGSPQRPAYEVQIPVGKRTVAPGPHAVAEPVHYLQRISDKLALSAGLKSGPRVRVVEDPLVYIRLSLNGELRITTGLLGFAQTESQLAGVLAHVLAHLARQQGSSSSGNRSQQVAAERACALSEIRNPSAACISLQSAESEANAEAVRYLAAVGYDPLEFVTLLSKLRFEKPDVAECIPIEGLLALRTDLENVVPPRAGYVLDSSAFQDLRLGLVAGSAELTAAQRH